MGEVAKIADVLPGTLNQIVKTAADEVSANRDSFPRLHVEHDRPVARIRIPAPYIAQKFRDATLDSFQPEQTAERVALKATRRFCERVIAGEQLMLALIGPPGTGKSHLLYAAAKELAAAERRVFTRPWYRLADHLRYGGPAPFEVEKQLESHQLREQIMQEPIVMIDEIRPTAGTTFDDNELAKICCNAWDNGVSMLVTTNFSLAEIIGDAPASRFTQITIDEKSRDRRQS